MTSSKRRLGLAAARVSGIAPAWSVALAVLSLATAAGAVPRILVVGDSWGAGAAPRFGPVLAQVGHGDKSAVSIAIPGLTAGVLNSPAGLQSITNALNANPTIDILHLSIGGNDMLGGWNNGLSPAQDAALFASIAANVEAIVDHALSVRPDIQVVIASYDYPNLWDTVIADPFGPPGLLWLSLGQPSPGQLNRAFFGDQACQGGGSTNGFEDHRRFIADARSRVHHANIEGFFQIAAQGACHIDLPTPTSFMAGGGTDPIHPTNAGYDLWILAAYYTAYAGLFNGPSLFRTPGVLAFGPVRVGTQNSLPVQAENAGPVGSRLEVQFGQAVSPVSGGGGGTHYLFVEQTNGQGDAASVPYTFAPTQRAFLEQQIGISSNGGSGDVLLFGQGVGPVLEASQASLDFGNLLLATSKTRTLEIRNTSADFDDGDATKTGLTLRSFQITGPNAADFEVLGFTPGQVLAKGQALTLDVVMQVVPPAGARAATLHVETDEGAPFGGAGTALMIPLSGAGVSCGLSVELAAILPVLLWLRRRRAR